MTPSPTIFIYFDDFDSHLNTYYNTLYNIEYTVKTVKLLKIVHLSIRTIKTKKIMNIVLRRTTQRINCSGWLLLKEFKILKHFRSTLR